MHASQRLLSMTVAICGDNSSKTLGGGDMHPFLFLVS